MTADERPPVVIDPGQLTLDGGEPPPRTCDMCGAPAVVGLGSPPGWLCQSHADDALALLTAAYRPWRTR